MGLLPPRDGTVSSHIPAGVQRLVSRLRDTATGVFAADWTLLSANPTWVALHGDPERLPLGERNLARARFGAGAASRMLQRSSPAPSADFDRSIVADLKRAATRYPDDGDLTTLIRDLTAGSVEFARLWSESAAAGHASSRKTMHHPVVGRITLDCDVLTAPGADLRIVVYTAPGGTDAESKLELLRVAGPEHLTLGRSTSPGGPVRTRP